MTKCVKGSFGMPVQESMDTNTAFVAFQGATP